MVNDKNYYRQRSNSEVALININNTIGFVEVFKEVADKAEAQGLKKEAHYYCLWRRINILFNGWKNRKYYKEQEWNRFCKIYSWKNSINLSFIKTFLGY